MRPNRLIAASLLFIIIAVILAEFPDVFTNKASYSRNVESILNQKCERIDKYFDRLKISTEKEDFKIIESSDKEDIILLKYFEDSLIFWSSNAIPVYEFYPNNVFAPSIVRFFNSYYYVKKRFEGASKYVGLIEIKSRYPYENEFLHTGFNKAFGLPDNARIRFQKGEGYEIYDNTGGYLFNILISDQSNAESPRSAIASVMLFIGLILFGFYVFALIQNITNRRRRLIAVITVIGSITCVRILQMLFSIGFKRFLLFDPFVFADSLLVPSLGDLLINSLIVLFFAVIINRSLKYSDYFNKIGSSPSGNIVIVLLNILLLVFFTYAHYFNRSLIFNSNISFEPNGIDRLSIYTLIGFFINGINFLAVGILLIWLINILKNTVSFFRIIQLIIPTTAVFFTLLYILDYPIDCLSVLFFLLFYFLFVWLCYKKYNLLSYSFLEVFVLLFSVYLLAYIINKSDQKEKTITSSLAVSLANEHDPIAEYLFDGLSRHISKDTSIINRLNKHSVDIIHLYDYLKKTYFTGYWNKYEIQITLCGPKDSVLVAAPEYQWFYCYGFFDDILNRTGLSLPGSSFYYLDKYTGRISYVGRIPFKLHETPHEITLFVELDSRLTSDLMGYPELLLDEELHQERIIDRYSHAKYHKGNLVAQYGNFGYSLSSELFNDNKQEIATVKLDGYEHLLYRPNNENLIVLSKPAIKFIDLLITFSYLFLFYYLCLVIAHAIRIIRNSEVQMLGNFRSKIQFSIITILLFSLLLIAGSTIWLNVRNYKQNENKILNEKIQSVLVELSRRLSFENELSAYWRGNRYDNLNQLLIKFSDEFYTDINLYNLKGDLLATSRLEVFQMGLQGEKMDPVAFHKMYGEKRAQFIHRERISDLSYISAYVPFVNNEGKLLAYLNLPYFTKQKEFQAALSALIVTITNIYVILILITISITILISDQITRPLEMLQLRFRDLKLGSRYEQINYKRKDEIGNLVAEYNKMVLELERSVKLLARSERESAWREMAKQIAHEIKNPLTPMRLSVQQLQRSWKDKQEDYEKYLERVTNTLIEQIDALSGIASEFSNFAKMPAAQIEKIDLIDVLKKTIGLFEGVSNYTIVFKTQLEKAEIDADRDQLSRVFLNIIKNAIQSLSEDQTGKIVVQVNEVLNAYEIKIIDNGRGIPEEIKPKLFTPNFTTKSGGMGLGLAIARNILDQIGAKISFDSKIGKGTTFILNFPTDKTISGQNVLF
jgi:signal transduction histidine kinase